MLVAHLIPPSLSAVGWGVCEGALFTRLYARSGLSWITTSSRQEYLPRALIPINRCCNTTQPFPDLFALASGVRVPVLPHLAIPLLDGSPCDTVGDLLAATRLPRAVGAPGIVECLAKNILSVLRQVQFDAGRQIVVRRVRHGGDPSGRAP